MGNITGLTRQGGSAAILAYSYLNGGLSNQLQVVTKGGGAYKSYAYDGNGNATSDGGSKGISYNLLNLPLNVTTGGTTLATYVYDAGGNKLRNTGTDGTWDYINGIVYNNNKILFVQTEEGRALPNGNTYLYQYYLKDHLGNTRVTFTKNSSGIATNIQENEYYAFGLAAAVPSTPSPANRYLYNGKEIQTDLASQYDYGARFYDPVIARWTTIDKLAEDPTQISLSPYQYVANDPISKDDPDGNCPSCFVGALVGAAVDYGEQVATNYFEGNAHPFTNNINLTSIGTAAVAGFVTSGGSVIENVGAKIAVKVGAALINNTVKVTTSSTGLNTTVETNALNVVKNTTIDLAADGAAGKIGGKIGGALSKVGVTNAGRLSSTAKKVVNALGQNVTRATTATVKAGLKATSTVAGKAAESTVKTATNAQRDAAKDKTNQ